MDHAFERVLHLYIVYTQDPRLSIDVSSICLCQVVPGFLWFLFMFLFPGARIRLVSARRLEQSLDLPGYQAVVKRCAAVRFWVW